MYPGHLYTWTTVHRTAVPGHLYTSVQVSGVQLCGVQVSGVHKEDVLYMEMVLGCFIQSLNRSFECAISRS